ncbi:MAG TPA: permease [Lamprocystis sp. (in: g-proteobacteria)]|nr:permease [Lamprocystis sp. (in: g-proteobacteria)]
MAQFVESFLAAFWQVLLDLSPSLLLGLLIAGLIHVYLPTGFIHRGLNTPNFRSVLRASLIGVPLPLCSCGVIPTALGLRNEGASKGATTAFMISTPQTGVDSILVTVAFLGWPFALFKLAAAFVTGLVGGVLVNRLTEPDPPAPPPEAGEEPAPRGLAAIVAALRYAVDDLLGAIDLWILAGVVVAALIGVLLPTDFFASQSWSQGILGMLVMLAIALPLYVCTTGSVPIAASLIAAGLPAGSALVFLMAGPASNVATFGAVYRTLGGRVLAIYLGTVAILSILFGLFFDGLLPALGAASPGTHQHAPGMHWIGTLSALLLIALMMYLTLRRVRTRLAPPPAPAADLTLTVQGMTCQHCVASVKRALEGCASVVEASPDLASGLVRVRGSQLDLGALATAVEKAGFQVKKTT